MAASRSYSSSSSSEGDSTSSDSSAPSKPVAPYKPVAPSDAVQALTRRKERSPKRARTTVTGKDPDSSRYGSEMLFMIYTGTGLTINAVDENGALIPSYCIKAATCSVPGNMGVTVIGSDLHIFGGILGCNYSLHTYTLDLHKIPQALQHGRDLLSSDPHNMIDQKISPIVYYARECVYVISGFIRPNRLLGTDCILDGLTPGRDIEYRPFPFKPDAPWSGLDNPPITPELNGPVSIEAHALAGDRSIVISLTDNRGAYVLSLESRTWTPLDTDRLCFTGQPALLPGGNYISPSKSTLGVFDGILLSPLRKLRIRGVSRCIRHTTTHQVAIMGGVVFIIRCGSSRRSDYGRAVYITIDTYEVSPSGDHITALLHPPKLVLDDSHPSGPLGYLHCFPVRLSG